MNGRSTTSSSHPTDPVNGTASGSSSDFADGDEFDEQRDESLDRRQDAVNFYIPLLKILTRTN